MTISDFFPKMSAERRAEIERDVGKFAELARHLGRNSTFEFVDHRARRWRRSDIRLRARSRINRRGWR